MSKEVYKYRSCNGMATYTIISGVFGVDKTLHLYDTSCTHPGPHCEIEVKMCENSRCYEFSKALNWTAKEYDYYHKLEKFWTTKEEAYIEALQISIKRHHEDITDNTRRLEEDEAKLAGMQKNEVQYFTSDMAKIGATCYLEIDGVTRIIGTILFEDGTTGYLTDNNYLDEDRYDSYGGDRIILIEKENRIKTEKGDVAFVSKTDFDNYKGNFKIERLIKSVDIYKKSIDCSTRIIKLCESIINQKESLTFKQMFDMRNGKVKD
jgi:hypothetical protein